VPGKPTGEKASNKEPGICNQEKPSGKSLSSDGTNVKGVGERAERLCERPASQGNAFHVGRKRQN